MGKIDNIDRSTDALFLLFYFANEVKGITKVQKLLFLIEEETNFGHTYRDEITLDFEGYKMGPFSPEVYDEIEFLINLGAIKKEEIEETATDSYEIKEYDQEEGSEGLSGKKFKITDKGEKIARKLLDVVDEKQVQELEEKVEKYNTMSLMQLLEYVYSEYPEMTTESEIKDQVLGDRPHRRAPEDY